MKGVSQNPWLDELPFYAVVMASETLGLMLAFGPDKQIGGLSPGQRCTAGEAGFEVVSNGKAAIRACLNDLPVRGGGPTWFQRWFYAPALRDLRAAKNPCGSVVGENMND